MSNWDNDIDDVARQMTDGEPDATFKARVLARIETPGPRRVVGWSIWAWSPLTAAGVVLIAVLIGLAPWKSGEVRLKPDTTHNSPTSVTTSTSPSGAPAASSSTASNAPSSTTSATASNVQAATRPYTAATRSYVVSAFGRTNTGEIGQMAAVSDIAPPPIDIDPLGVEAMEAMESLEIPKLDVAPLEVARLSVD